MKAYGRNEAVGLHSVDTLYPDKQDLIMLGASEANKSKNMTRKLQRKVARNGAKREIRSALAA